MGGARQPEGSRTTDTATATLFSGRSEAYARYRPGYPPTAIDAILEPFHDLSAASAVDVGAGTGIASRLLADRGIRVLAVEPNADMIRSAEPHPLVSFRQAVAEETGVADSSVDLVTSFQAFHWFRFPECLREFRRILKPEGRLALVSNRWDRSDPFTRRYADLLRDTLRKNPRRVSPYRGLSGRVKQVRIKVFRKFGLLPCFQDVRMTSLSHFQVMDLPSLIGCALSQSSMIGEGPDWDSLVEEIRRLSEAHENPRLAHRVDVYAAAPRK
jgi:SAM-dependent methyltransferase